MRTKQETAARWESETAVSLRYGAMHEVKGLVPAAVALAGFTKQARRVAESNIKVALKAMEDPTLAPAERTIRAADHAKRGLTELDSQYNRLFDEAEATAKALRARLEDAAAPSANPGRAIQDVALVTMLREVADPAQVAAMVQKDPDLLRAVATAPRALSGFSEEGWNAVRRQHWAKVEPDALAQLDDLVSALEAAELAHKSAHKDTADLVDFETAAELASRRMAA